MDDEAADEMAAMQQPDYPPEDHSKENNIIETPYNQPHRTITYQESGVGGGESGDSSAMNALAAAAEARQSPPSLSTMGAAPTHRTGKTTPASATTAMVTAAAVASASMSTPKPQQQITTPSPPLSATMQYIPPGGRVVESGQEQTGRWTREEHEAFLTGLQLYGKEWKKVAAGVKTRTVVQTRTHAQKYFQKLTKGLEGASESEIQAAMEMFGEAGSTPNPMKAANFAAAAMDLGMGGGGALPPSGTKAKKRGSKVPYSASVHPKTPNPISRSPSAATAATLLNMSNDRRITAATLGTSSSTTDSSAGGIYSSQHGFAVAANNDASILGDAPTTSSTSSSYGYGSASASGKSMVGGGISIVAPPTHDEILKTGKYPEPSPAACGKRKLAEIAAAQMLAGVVGAANRRLVMTETTDSTNITEKRRSNTPPPPPPADEDTYMNTPGAAGTADITSSQAGTLIGYGGALQILNPDAFGDRTIRRSLSGSASPHTPWDGQLAALVSQVKGHELPVLPPPLLTQDPNASESAMTNQALATSEIEVNRLPLPLRCPRSALHLAICNSSVSDVSRLCSTAAESNFAIINERDDAGFHPLHSAIALVLLDRTESIFLEVLEICRMLINNGADVMCRDIEGNTPLHWAARAGHSEVLGLLVHKNCPLNAQNDAGETALHWAMRAGSWGVEAVKALVENGARVNIFNRNFKRPLDVAADGFRGMCKEAECDDIVENDASVSTVDQRERRATRWNLMKHSPQCRTLVLHHHECLEHLAKADHDWEVPDRISNIMSTLTNRTTESCGPEDEQCFSPCEITVSNEFERATLELLSRIHSAEYLSFVNDLSKELERKRKQQLIENTQSNLLGDEIDEKREVVPFTPMIQRKILNESTTKEDGHSDTAFSAGSLKAARRAAGAVQHAVDCVLVGRNRNAFCIVRPPGHHAGINGLLSDAESCGFCLFNNVAAGAMHALSDEHQRPKCERCAIVDIDAHHGNGTEEIVRKCHDSGRLLFFSVHLYDYDKPVKGFQYKFYPGTGAEDEVAHNIINVPIAPLWREKDVVKSISLASNGGASVTTELRQTRQRSKDDAARRVPSVPDLSVLNNEEATTAASLKPINGNASVESASVTSDSSQSSKPRQQLPSASPHYPPHYLMGVGRLAYRRAIQHRLLPALRAFNPDLIILSTGFDAARGDVGNARHYINGTQAMGFDLEPEDYAWTARKVCEVADICCDGRVVSVLEGGYGRTPPNVPPPPVFGDEQASEPVKQRLDKSFFSECAIQHLKGLVDPYHKDEQDRKDSSNRKRL